MSNFKAPILRVGDPVKFHADPHNDNAKPYVGWCLSEATHNDATNLLVFTPRGRICGESSHSSQG